MRGRDLSCGQRLFVWFEPLCVVLDRVLSVDPVVASPPHVKHHLSKQEVHSFTQYNASADLPPETSLSFM
jgi:hypothetical protein